MGTKPKRALDPAAVQAANEKLWEAHKDDEQFWKDHPDGMLSLQTSDYKLRKEWMSYYNWSVAQDMTTAPVSGASSCQGTGGSSSPPPTNATVPPPPPPNAPPPEVSQTAPPPPPAHQKTIVCGLTEASIHCQHGRNPSPTGDLEVVAPGSSDTITCSSKITGSCGSHPVWNISGRRNKSVIGTATSFFALHSQNYRPVETEGILHLPVWLGDVAPWEYWVDVSSCNGAGRAFHVSAYPADEISVKLSGQTFEEKIKPVLEKINHFLSKLFGIKIEVKFFVGAVEFSAKWKEHTDYRAFYNWALAGQLNPFLGIEGKWPLAALPDIEIAGGGIYVAFSGEVNLKLSGGQHAPDTHSIKGEAEGKVQIGVSASLYLIDPEFMSAEGFGYTGITGTCEPKIEGGIIAELGLAWEPLSLKLTYKAMFYSQEHTLKMFNDIELGKWELPITSGAESAAGAE
jgi:hypothetical protein